MINIFSPSWLAFFGFTVFSLMDVVNKFFFATTQISFFNYVLWLDFAILFSVLSFVFISQGLSMDFLKTQNKKAILIRSLLSVLNTFASLLAISHLPLHMFYALAFMQPIFATIFAFIFMIQKINLKKIILIFLAFLGMTLAVEFFNQESFIIPILGLIGGLGIAITGALSGIVVKKYLPRENILTVTTYNILLSIIVVSLILVLSKESLFIPNTNIENSRDFLILFAGILACIGMIFFMKSYQKGAVQNIAIIQYTQIVVGIAFGYLIFKDIPSLYNILGILIILIATLLNSKIKN